MPKMAMIYCHVASLQGGDKSDPLKEQEERCCWHAQRMGFMLAVVFTDAGVSGRSADRPGLDAMMQQLAAPCTDEVVVVVDDVSRLARDPQLLSRIHSELDRMGVQLETPSGVVSGLDIDFVPYVVAEHRRQNAINRRNRKR